MNDLYTTVAINPHVTGYSCLGRKTHAEAIIEAKAHFEYVAAECAVNLAAIADGTIGVTVHRGWNRPEVIEVLTPD